MRVRQSRKTRGRPARGSSPALSRERIVRAALEIVDHEGLTRLSMRRLGSRLEVDPMAIYYHLPGKAALYDAIVEAVMGEIDLSAPLAGSPLDQLKGMAAAYKDALLAHPNALPVVAARPVRTPGSLRPVERMLEALGNLGFSARTAIAIVDVCAHFVMGWAMTYVAHLQDSEMHRHGGIALDSLPAEEFPQIHQVIAEAGTASPFETEFEMGVDALMRGLLAGAKKPLTRRPHSSLGSARRKRSRALPGPSRTPNLPS